MTLSLLYYSFRELPLGDATTIIFSSPLIVIALSFLFLKEPCGVLRIMVVCTLFAGVVLVARPPFLFQVIISEEKPIREPNSDATRPLKNYSTVIKNERTSLAVNATFHSFSEAL